MKNLPLTIATVFFVICSQLVSETVIPAGEVSGTWTKTESPYRITGNVIIPDSATLEIEPGVLLQFNDKCKMTVRGRLLSVGNENDSIIFTNYGVNSVWHGIKFEKISEYNDSSIIKFCYMKFGSIIEVDSCSKIEISNSRFSDNYSVIHCYYASPVIKSNIIINNGFNNLHGPCIIYCYHSSPEINDNYFAFNGGEYGTIIYCEEQSNPEIINCTITQNSLKKGKGSILILNNCNPHISNCTITKNSTRIDGGGIFCDNTSAIIEDCLISENSARRGGGLYVDNNCNIIIKNSVISFNRSGVSGGGIVCNNSTALVNGCLIVKNFASEYGGLDLGNGKVTIINSTIVNNYANNCGGLSSNINNESNQFLKIINSILLGNDNGNIMLRESAKHPDFYNSFVEGGKEQFIITEPIPFFGKYENMIISDPKFTYDPSTSYTLSENSPCINSGIADTSNLNLTYLDLLGNPRIFGDRIDIGAYEFQGEQVGEQEFELSTLSLTFSAQKIGISSAKKSFILRNEGFANLSLELFSASKSFKIKKTIDSSYKSNINLILKPTEETLIEIVFIPELAKMYSEQITIFSNDSDEENISISLSGEGVDKPVFGGVIEKDTCWADSILIVADIFIPDNITLCIEPGTQVIFTGHYKIDVQGSLHAMGKENKLITFTVSDTTLFSDTTTTDGGWNGIRFINTPETNDTSKIIFCILEYGGKKNKAMNDANGGALYVKNFSQIIFENNIVSHNLALGNGGGIYCESASFTMNNNLISYNISYEDGGGISCLNGATNINGNIIDDNYSDSKGGGINCKSDNSIISNNEIYNNECSEKGYYGGGGIMISGGNKVIIYNNIIHNNYAKEGGGIHTAYGGNEHYYQYEYCLILNNYIYSNSALAGGGIQTWRSEIINNMITNNHTSNYYGAIRFKGDSFIVVNCTICNNYGGGIYITYGNPKIYNSIIFNDYPNIKLWDEGDEVMGPQSVPHFYYCDIKGGKGSIIIDNFPYKGDYKNNIDKDPLFTSDPENPYSLSENSPCINAGAPDTTGLNIPLYDIIGMPRIHAGRIDIGAYEFQGEVSVKELMENNFISIYPNPTDGFIIIDVLNPKLLPLKFGIIDIFGREIKVDSIREIHNRLDLSEYPNGNYYLIIKDDKQIASKKFVIYK